jgi:hypothetical protein
MSYAVRCRMWPGPHSGGSGEMSEFECPVCGHDAGLRLNRAEARIRCLYCAQVSETTVAGRDAIRVRTIRGAVHCVHETQRHRGTDAAQPGAALGLHSSAI